MIFFLKMFKAFLLSCAISLFMWAICLSIGNRENLEVTHKAVGTALMVGNIFLFLGLCFW